MSERGSGSDVGSGAGHVPPAGAPPGHAPSGWHVFGPSAWLIVLHRIWWVWGAAIAAAGWMLWRTGWVDQSIARATLAGAAISALVLVWNTLDYATRRYVLSTTHVARHSGILRRAAVEVPLENIQSVTVLKSIRERVFGLGTVGISTAGRSGFEFTWFMVSRPEERAAAVQRAMAQAQG